MVAVVITTKSGDKMRLWQESPSIAEVESQIVAILKKTTPYATFVDLDGSVFTVKRSEVESFIVADIENEETADDNETD